MPSNPKLDLSDLIDKNDLNQDPAQALEEALIELLLNPNELKRALTTLHGRRLAESMEATFINQHGHLEHHKHDHIIMLDDGTPASGDIAICQNCGGTAHVDNLRRCPCGRMACINCAKWRCGEYYCSTLHQVLHGAFGINIRP